jgi:hypothetical protein
VVVDAVGDGADPADPALALPGGLRVAGDTIEAVCAADLQVRAILTRFVPANRWASASPVRRRTRPARRYARPAACCR